MSGWLRGYLTGLVADCVVIMAVAYLVANFRMVYY